MKRKMTALFKPIRVCLLAMCTALLCSTSVPAQDVASVPQPVKKNTVPKSQEKLKAIPLQDLMLKLQKSHGIYFSYQADALKETMVIYAEGEEKQKTDAAALLKKVLTPAGLTFEKVNNVYIIKQVAAINTVYAPETASSPVDLTVKGRVTDGSGPVANATVTEKGTSSITSTNNDGAFSINVSGPNAILVISHIGYTTKEVAVEGQSQLNITLAATSRELEQVVVTALGISREKRALAYSVANVKSEDLVKAANPNILKSLDGKVSGVNFVNLSSDPTSSVLVNIRGTTAIPTLSDANVSLKGQPLYVIDGIPVGAQTFTSKDGVDFGNILSQLNPEDIDNVTILKGGSAGALYGADGGNGVIMITTKSGRGGKRGIGVSFNSSGTWEQPYQFIQEQTRFGQGERAFEWQYDNTDTWGPALDGSYTSDYWDVKDQQWKSKPMVSSFENRVKSYLQTGNTFTNSISVQGNYDRGAFRFSMSNMDNKGVMPNTKTNQKSLTLNSDYKLTNKVRISVSTSYIRTYSPNKANSVGSNSVINNLLFNMPTNLQPLSDMKNYWLTGYEGIQQNGAIMRDNAVDVGTDNPWWTTYERVHRFSRDNYFGKVQLDWQLSKSFSLLLRTGMENVKENYELRQSWGKTAMARKFLDGDGQFVTGTNNSLMANSDAILTYNQNFGKFTLSASAGGNYGYSNSNSLEMNAGKLATPGLFTLTNAMPGQLSVSSSSWGVGQSISAYGVANLGYDNQLFLDITGRNDWRGILGEEKIHYFYPSAALSWIASETIKFPDVFNLVKARLSWADVGNGLTKTRSVDRFSYDPSDWGAVKTVSISASLVDPNIKAMHSITKEAGLDLAMFSNRLRFDFTYFIKDQKDQIDNIPIDRGSGYTGVLTNIGDVRSKGLEAGITIVPVKTRDFTWDISATFTHYKATITRLSDQFAPSGYVFASYDGKTNVKIAKGEEIGNIYEQNPILRMKTGKYAGMPILDGSGGEFQTSGDERDRAMLGNYNPKYLMGINTTLRYKRFALNLVGSFRKGGKYISVNQQYLESNGRATTTLSSGADNPWWSGGRTAELGGHPWPAAGSSAYDAINENNDGQRSDFQDASYAKGIFLNPDYAGDPADATDADYIINGADPNNTFYQIPYNSYGDVIWDFTATRVYDATNFKLRELSLSYNIPNNLVQRYKLNNLTLSFIARNVFQWNASGRHEDPESAFTGVGTNQGILRATLPSIRSYGFKLSVDF